MRTLGAVAAFVLLLVIGTYLVLAALQRQLIFPNSLVQAPEQPRSLPEGAEQWWLETPQGRVEAWYLRGEERSEQSPGPAVIFAHGNAEVIDEWPHLLRWYVGRGVSALIVEYRGYGRSEGTPSTDVVERDMRHFAERLVGRSEVDGDRLVYHGRSLGGGAVCALAGTSPPAALILQSTFASIEQMAWDHYRAPSFLLSESFDNRAVVESYDGDLLVTHGRDDQIVPFEHGRQLHRAAEASQFVALDCGHNDCPMGWDVIESFLFDAGIVGSEGD